MRGANFIDLTGQTYNELTAIKRVPNRFTPNGTQKTMWLCRCSCGNLVEVSSNTLRKNRQKRAKAASSIKKHEDAYNGLPSNGGGGVPPPPY